jgi:hypothetical protein
MLTCSSLTGSSSSPSQCVRTSLGVIVLASFLLIGAQRAHGQVCAVSCSNGAAGECPGGTGCPDTPEECLDQICRNPGSCGCGALTVCTFDGVDILPPPVCGDGRREGDEECDPGIDPTGFGENDCDCPDQCQPDCTCPSPKVCSVSCSNGAAGECPGGTGCPDTPEECLDQICRNPGSCGCGALTVCTFDGVDILPPPVCGDGRREGDEECDPGVDPTGFGENDCACPDQCQTDCTCPGAGDVCGNNVREGAEQCDGTDNAACLDLCQANCTCSGDAVPTVSEWGMVVLVLSLLVGIKLKFGRRQTLALK